LMATEWLRGHILTGFPWNVLGYALTMPLAMMQWAGLFGIYTLTAIVAITLTAPLVVLADETPAPLLKIAVMTVLPLTGGLLYGVWQLNANPPRGDEHVRIRLVQPSFTQRDKFEAAKRWPIFLRHLELSGNGLDGQSQLSQGANARVISPRDSAPLPPTHILWPEAAVPFLLRRTPNALAQIDKALPDHVQLIVGTFRINVSPDVPNERVGRYRVFNTAMVVGGNGTVQSIYDKIHLVPFGEYLPAQTLLTALGFENLTRTKGGLAPGKHPRRLMQIAGLPPAAMLICYEGSFPSEVVQGRERPGVLINLTNDAWFGATSGPYQHFHQTRVRAVEFGLPMLRSANTGISAIVGPMGRIQSHLGLNQVGVVDGALPVAATMPFYARYGMIGEFGFIVLLMAGIALMKIIGLRTKHGNASAQ